ncbi:hypothetical protein VIGAN_09181300 [Vigna angularis var. angularis]|uniref:Apple domain-containing protein n=1 Tax=Vigna angularis var. angularis TaxID=157739 RepID=A0A0S3T043_PHAAN|nr:hypothetical protein VIGAN_09181300 [Vigna angularis var. angularis]
MKPNDNVPILTKTDSEVSSLSQSSPPRSPRRPVYYIQSPSHESASTRFSGSRKSSSTNHMGPWRPWKDHFLYSCYSSPFRMGVKIRRIFLLLKNLFNAFDGQTVLVEQSIGGFGVCTGEASNICECVSGFEPLDGHGWGSDDYYQGCHHVDAGCDGDDGFEDLEAVRFGFGIVSLVKGKSRSFCERECLGDYGCVGLSFEKHSGLCKKFCGSLSDFQNLTIDGENGVLHVRVPSEGSGRKVFDWKVLSGVVIGSIVVLGVVMVTLLMMVKRRVERKKLEEDEEDGF